MFAKLLDVLERSHSTVFWPYQLASFALFWFGGFYTGWGIAEWYGNGDAVWASARNGTGAFFLWWGLQWDTAPIGDERTVDDVEAERKRQRESLRAPKRPLEPRQQRPRLRLVAWSLLITSGLGLGVSPIWIESIEQASAVCTAIGVAALLALAGVVVDARARDQATPWVRLYRLVFPARRRPRRCDSA